MGRTALLCGWLGLACALGAPAVAQAQEPEPSAADKENARTLFAQGDEAYRSGNFGEALSAFEAADAIMKVPTTGLEVGRTLVQLNRFIDAAEILNRVASSKAQPDEHPAQRTAREEAGKLLDDVRARTPQVTVDIVGVPPGGEATLRIDAAVIPQAAQGFPRRVDPGPHMIRVFVPGFEPYEQEVEVAEGADERVTVTLTPTEDETTVDPWQGMTDQSPDGADQREFVFSPLAGVFWGLHGVGMIAGSITGIMTFAKVDEYNSRPATEQCGGIQGLCPQAADDHDTATAIAHVSTASFVVAGVGLAAAVIVMIAENQPASGETAFIAPYVAADGVGVRF